MKRLVSTSLFVAAMGFFVAGCSMMPSGSSNSSSSSASTREQCRQQSVMIGTQNMRRNDMTAKRDIDCATMMPN